MPYYRRGFLYLARKRAKSGLLLLIFLIVNSMILGINLILHATQNTEAAMQEKTNAKAVCEITDQQNPITEEDVEGMGKLADVVSVNRMGEAYAFLSQLTPVTASASGEDANRMVRLLAYDDLSKDGPFGEQAIRLTEGQLITPQTGAGAVVNQIFARANGVGIGDTISLETEEGKKVSVPIIGLYLAGNEDRQDDELPAISRIENQIYMDQSTYQELFGDAGYEKVWVYTDKPEQLEHLAENLGNLLGDKVEITTSDALFQQMRAPLTQLTRVVELMRLFTFLTGTVVVSLLLCMWMRSRQREMAILISLGEYKGTIFLQALMETAVIFLAAGAGACGLGQLAAGWLERMLLSSLEADIALELSLHGTDVLLLFGISGAAAMIAVCLSLIPVIRTNPRDILSRMEG